MWNGISFLAVQVNIITCIVLLLQNWQDCLIDLSRTTAPGITLLSLDSPLAGFGATILYML